MGIGSGFNGGGFSVARVWAARAAVRQTETVVDLVSGRDCYLFGSDWRNSMVETTNHVSGDRVFDRGHRGR